MLDHVSFSVNDYLESRKFYDETLKLLGYEVIMNFETEDQNVAGYGKNGKPSFWIGSEAKPNEEEIIGKSRGLHVAFTAPDVESIKAWHTKALELGGVDNGAPGPRSEYHPGYYAAFIIDPNGWRIEAVLHDYSGE